MINFQTYTVPLTRNNKGDISINHELIERTINYVYTEIMKFWFTMDDNSKILDKFAIELDEYMYTSEQD